MNFTLYQWLIIVFPFLLSLVVSLFPKHVEKCRFRIIVALLGILFSAGVYREIVVERSQAEKDRTAAIQETSAKVAAETTARVTKVLNLQFDDERLLFRILRKESKATAVEVHTMFQDNSQAGERKRQIIVDQLKKRLDQASSILETCALVGPPGSGGVRADICFELSSGWEMQTTRMSRAA